MTSPDFTANDLICAVVQDVETKDVLMVAYMNEPAWEETRRTQMATFFSRSRQQLWRKGATSGNTMHVESIAVDCDGDTVILQVHPAGPACHTGNRTCFTAAD